MRWLTLALLCLLVLLQYRLWLAEEGSLAERSRLQRDVDEQRAINVELRSRNQLLERQVLELQRGPEALEERAREELGMIKEGETLYLLQEAEGNSGD